MLKYGNLFSRQDFNVLEIQYDKALGEGGGDGKSVNYTIYLFLNVFIH